MEKIWKDEGYRSFVIWNFIDDVFNNRSLYDDIYDNAMADLVNNYPDIKQLFLDLYKMKEYVGALERLATQHYDKNIDDKSVYLIKDNSKNTYKIWVSYNPTYRIKALSIWNTNLEMVHQYESDNWYREELRLHNKYKIEWKHVAWERFHLTDEDIAYIKTL